MLIRILPRIFPTLALCTAYYVLAASNIPAFFHAALAAPPSLHLPAPRPAFKGTPLPPSQTLLLVDWVEDRMNTQLLPLPVIVTDSLAHARCWLPQSEYGEKIVSAEEKGNIFIDDRHADLTDPGNASIVVHELVHYAQEIEGRAYVCRSQREAEAYEQQNKFLAEHDRPPIMSAEKIARMKECLPTVAGLERPLLNP